jgi:hypothetical protein
MHDSDMFSDSKSNVDLARTGLWPMTTSVPTDIDPPALGMVVDFTPANMQIFNVCPVPMILSYN